ncbi:MAG: ATP-binding protein [Cyanobacteria bacterium P01_A01_bin.114]
MSLHRFSRHPFQRFRQAKLRTILVVPFVLQIVSTIGVIGYLSYVNSQQALQQLAFQLETKLSDRLQEKVQSYLAKPHEFHQITLSSIRSGTLDPNDFPAVEKFFWQQIHDHGLVTYAYFGNPQGDLISVKQDDDGSLVSRQRDDSTGGERQEYALDDSGNRTELVKSRPYDGRERPWYQAAVEAQQPTWSPISPAFDDEVLEINAVIPIYDETNTLQGILGSELNLSQITDFLQSLQISPSGQAFIMEHSGEVVGTSTKESPFVLTDALATEEEDDLPAGESAERGTKARLNATLSQDPLTRATATHLLETFGDFEQITEAQNLSFMLNGKRQLVRVMPLQDQPGLDWLMVVAIPESDFMGQIYTNARNTVLLCIGALILSLIIGGLTARWITRPVQRINRAAKEIANGNLSQQVKISQPSELEELGNSFNHMATQLKQSFQALEALNLALTEREQQLEGYNVMLETEVQERTQKLLVTEKMAALGQLTAGVAHELNTPLGAVRAANENVMAGLQQSFQQLPQMLLRLTPEQITDFLNLLTLIQKPRQVISFREERQLRQTLQKDLSERGIEPAVTLADLLSKIGVTPSDLEALTSLLKTPQNRQIIEATHAVSMVTTNSQTIRTAVDRAARIIFALKSYTHRDVSKNAHASIADGIDAILTLYQNHLKRGVELVKDYQPVPEVPCDPEDLMQVWTNLIHNALQAMNYQGQLGVKVAQQGRQAVVTITDTGSGISPQHRDRIFEPFFTTKAKGEGTGLGLDIVQRIIEKYHGRIEVESRPGHTVFQVWLPLERTGSDPVT